jgi:2'-5' RNA ligase
MHRLFVALRPPAAIRDALSAAQANVPQARWQDDDQLHLTLRFVGEVDARTADDVAAAVGTVRAERIVARIEGVGSFGHTLWAGVGPRDTLTQLHHKVDRALALAGIEPDQRAFAPHVTLARIAKTAANAPEVLRWLGFHAGMRSGEFELDRVILYESHLGSEGASYEPVTIQPLV